jgi:hypothetical protein
MSLKLQFACLSLGAAVDQQTGNLSVFDVIEEVRTHQLPIQLQSLVISLSLEKQVPSAFDGKIIIHILTPDGKQAMVGNGEMKVPASQKRMRAVFRFGGFPLMNYGAHRFVLSWLDTAGTKIGEALLDFEVVQTAQVAQALTPGEKPQVAH